MSYKTSAQQDEREAFEAWIRGCEGHPFAGQFANLMWKAWQARAQQVQADAGPTAAQWDDLNADMGEIIAALGMNPDSYGGAAPIVQAIEDLKSRAQQVQADAVAVAVAEADDLLRACHRWHAGDGHTKKRIENVREALAVHSRPAAESDKSNDAALLDWLMHNIGGSALRAIGVITSAGCDRDAIRAAMSREQSGGQ